MIDESASDGSYTPPTLRRAATRRPYVLLQLVASVLLIGAAAVALCCLVAIVALLVIYAQGGAEAVTQFYEDLRIDFPLMTRISAWLISALYVGTAIATLIAAVLRGGRDWMSRVALTRVRGQPWAIIAIFAATIVYGAVATLTMALMRDHRLVVSGPTDVALLITISINLIVLAPLAEELLFRGWLYTGLRRQMPFWPTFLLTGAAFAAMHWDAAHRRIFLVLPLAVALGLLRELTGSIKPTIILHACYNTVIVLITLLEV